MSRIKSKKYNGVYLNKLSNGDISYSIVYKDELNKMQRFTIGKKSQGITEIYAYQKRSECINKINLGEDPIAHKKKRAIVSLDMLAEIYFTDKAYENKNNDRSRGVYNLHIQPLFGKRDIFGITKKDVLDFRNSYIDKRAPKTINGYVQLLTAIINYNIKVKDLKLINPCTGIPRLKANDNRERFLTTSEINELLKELRDENLYIFAKLALCTGGRLESILHIQKKDFDLDNRFITLKDLKNDDVYKGFIPTNLVTYFEGYLKNLKKNDFVVGGGTKKLPSRTITRHMKSILDNLFNGGLDKRDSKNRVVTHTFRHTFASHLAINGTPIFTIQKLMNHKDIQQTMRYAKLAQDSGRDMVEGLYQ